MNKKNTIDNKQANCSPDALPDFMLEPFVRQALTEDLGVAGDVTSTTLIPSTEMWQAAIVTRQAGVVCGINLARLAFHTIDPTIKFNALCQDGDVIEKGAVLARVHGNARAMLTAERTALNFMTHLSGIATTTRAFVDAIKPYNSRICCTRKTVPGLRALAKYAVRAGGGFNHRFGLGDAVLIKDNHIALAGSVSAAVDLARARIGHLMCIEVEVETLDETADALAAGVQSLQCDNMPPDLLQQAVELAKEYNVTTVASGGITLETARQIAATGVDVLAIGAITHSAKAVDIGLDDDR